jgi:hypothetical protein
MSLVKSKLEKDILAALSKQTKATDPAKSRKEIAADLAGVIDAYIRSATVTIIVSPPSLMAGAYPVVGTVTGTLS